MMTSSEETDRVKTMLTDTIKLLCKNGLTFKSEFSIAATIGITLDNTDVVLVSINENVCTSVTDDISSKRLKPHSPSNRKRRKTDQEKRVLVEEESDNVELDCVDLTVVKQEELTDEQLWLEENRDDAMAYNSQDRLRDSSSGSTAVLLPVEQETFKDDPTEFAPIESSTSETDAQDLSVGDISHWSSTFSSKRERLHVQNQHGSELQTNTCYFCKENFGTVNELISHRLQHHSDKSQYTHFCQYCGKAYTCGSNLKGHIQTHHMKNKPYKCEMCDSDFGYKHHLQRHMNTVHFGIGVSKNRSSEQSPLVTTNQWGPIE